MCDIDITIGKHHYSVCAHLMYDYIDFNLKDYPTFMMKPDKKILIQSLATREHLITHFETWLLNTLEHEILHVVLKNHISEDASICLDHPINNKNLEWELLKEKTKEGVTL